MGGGEGLLTRYWRKLPKSCGNGERGEAAVGCKKVAEMERGDELTGYDVSCQEMAEMGGGEELSRAAFTCQKIAGMR